MRLASINIFYYPPPEYLTLFIRTTLNSLLVFFHKEKTWERYRHICTCRSTYVQYSMCTKANHDVKRHIEAKEIILTDNNMKKKKLRPYMAPQCTIISMDDVPMLMKGSPAAPAANMDIDHWGKGTSETPGSDTKIDPTDDDWGWLK